jgi:hypothetical protein
MQELLRLSSGAIHRVNRSWHSWLNIVDFLFFNTLANITILFRVLSVQIVRGQLILLAFAVAPYDFILTRLAFDDLRLSQTSACAYDLSREALGQGRPMIANRPLKVDPAA